MCRQRPLEAAGRRSTEDQLRTRAPKNSHFRCSEPLLIRSPPIGRLTVAFTGVVSDVVAEETPTCSHQCAHPPVGTFGLQAQFEQ